jgi:hypothetical protein
MEWGRSALSAVVLVCAVSLGGCLNNPNKSEVPGTPRGPTVAFDSIDGLPRAQFDKLVSKLNEEAQSRRLAVISREGESVYRVRGALAAKVERGRTTVSWVWDVYDQSERRALRITGEESAKAHGRDGWSAADDAMLQRIARASIDQLDQFLASAQATAPAAQREGFALASMTSDPSSPESAGIFRIFQSKADPADSGTPENAEAAPESADSVPLPRRRPGAGAFTSADNSTPAGNGG